MKFQPSESEACALAIHERLLLGRAMFTLAQDDVLYKLKYKYYVCNDYVLLWVIYLYHCYHFLLLMYYFVCLGHWGVGSDLVGKRSASKQLPLLPFLHSREAPHPLIICPFLNRCCLIKIMVGLTMPDRVKGSIHISLSCLHICPEGIKYNSSQPIPILSWFLFVVTA